MNNPTTSSGAKGRLQQVTLGQSVQVRGAEDPYQNAETQLEAYQQKRLQQIQAELAEKQAVMQAEIEAYRQTAMAAIDEKAQARLANTEAEVEAARQAGEEAGHEAGYQDGLKQAAQKAADMLNSAQTVLDAAYGAREKVLRGFKHQTSQLIWQLSQKILGQAFSQHPDLLVLVVDQAIERLSAQGQVKIVTSTQTLQALQGFLPQTDEALQAISRVNWQADPQLGLNQFFVITEEGQFDIGPETQLQELIKLIQKPLNQLLDEQELVEYQQHEQELVEYQQHEQELVNYQQEQEPLSHQQAPPLADNPSPENLPDEP